MEGPNKPNTNPPRKPEPGKPAPRRKTAKPTPAQLRTRRLVLVGGLCLLALVIGIVAALVSCNRGPTGPAVLETGESAGAWAKNEQGFYFNDEGTVITAATKKGIDVSKYQGEIDWQKAKDAGIDFAMIRCGFGSEWNGEGAYAQDDDYWERNADACTALGIPFGTYLYSYATSEEQARSEGDHVARLLGLKAPDHEGLTDYTAKAYQLAYPVYYDLEDKAITGLFPEEMAAITAAFFDQLASYGYTGEQGIYASLNWTRARLQDAAFDAWRSNFWIARFASNLNYVGPYTMWQASYTEPGEAYGVQSETVDIDFVMEDLLLTGFTDAQGNVSFSNDTYKNELAMGKKGDHATLTTTALAETEGGQKIFWTSSDEAVATVSKKGVVKAKAAGSCTVTGTLADGRQSVSCTVRVGDIGVRIYATGSLAGQTANDSISLADLAALKAADPDSILLDAGGSLQGTATASLTGGMDMTSAFSAAGYDLQCFDGIDLAFGSERLQADANTAAGPSLASNLRAADGTLLFYRSTSWNRNRITNGMNYVIQEAGKKIGFFALSSTGQYANAAAMTANDPVQTAGEQVAALQAAGVDAIVCVVGPDTDADAILQDLAKLGVSAVVDGGAVSPSGGSLTVVPAGGGLDAIGALELTFTADGGVTASLPNGGVISAASLKAGRESLTETQRASYTATDNALNNLNDGDAAVAGQRLFTLAPNTEAARTVSFANYTAGVYESLAAADAANRTAEDAALPLTALAGGVGELENGEITRGALLGALPAGERLLLVRTTSAAVQQLIDSGTVAQTYLDSLRVRDLAEGAELLITDTATLKTLSDQNYTVLRDYGDVYWDIRMNINDATNNFADDFVLPEAPTIGVGRGDA